MFNKIKPIRHYFPDIPTALEMIKEGRKKYKNSTKYVLTESLQIARGQLLGKLYIDSALAAIMYATGKEPKDYDLNTPSETYGWNFNDTRDILNALDSLSRGNDYYWRLYYEEPGTTKIISSSKKITI